MPAKAGVRRNLKSHHSGDTTHVIASSSCQIFQVLWGKRKMQGNKNKKKGRIKRLENKNNKNMHSQLWEAEKNYPKTID